MKNTSHEKQQVYFSESLLVQLKNGVEKIKLKLLEHHQIKQDIVYQVIQKLQIKIELLVIGKKYVIVEFPVKNKWMILKDKKIISHPSFLIMKLFPILVQVLIGKGKDYYPFWNNQTMDLSKKLWLPIETDLQDSVSNLSIGYWKKMEQNSWFSMMKFLKKKSCQMISCPSYISSLVERWEKENIKKIEKPKITKKQTKTLKVKIFPNSKQKKIIREWINTSRYISNVTIAIKNNISSNKDIDDYKFFFKVLKNSLILNITQTELYILDGLLSIITFEMNKRKPKLIPSLRELEYKSKVEDIINNIVLRKNKIGSPIYVNDKFIMEIFIKVYNYKPEERLFRDTLIPAKKVPINQKWQLKTPKEIRTNAIKQVLSNYKTCYTNMKNGNINNFKMKFRSKKQLNKHIIIPKAGFKILENNQIQLYPKFIKKTIRYKKDKQLNQDVKVLDNIKIITNTYDHIHVHIPIQIEHFSKPKTKEKKICSLDPGIKTFQTIYGVDNIIKSGFNDRNELLKMNKLIDNYISLKSSVNKYYKKKINNKIISLRTKMYNKIDEVHWKTINYIIKNYNTILLPKFGIQKNGILSILQDKKSKRNLLSWRHYNFKNRLIYKSHINKCIIKIVDESYTSKTCTNCGWINNNLGSQDIFKCKDCKIEIDRDTTGSRNILLKELTLIRGGASYKS